MYGAVDEPAGYHTPRMPRYEAVDEHAGYRVRGV